jgi:hypothetical protein
MDPYTAADTLLDAFLQELATGEKDGGRTS